MNRHRDRDIADLLSRVCALATLAERALRDAIWAILHHDISLARSVMEGDDAIDDLAGEINETSFRLIARYQPVASDLRALEAAIRMALDLERISDLAGNLAKITVHFGEPLSPPDTIRLAGERVVEMLSLAMRAFSEQDAEMAVSVCAMDDEVDDREKETFLVMTKEVVDGSLPIERASAWIAVARSLERIGDHSTNLAEQIIYMTLGKRVKASQYRRPKETSCRPAF